MLSISDSLTPIARTYPSTEALVQIAQHPGHDLGGADSTFELLPRDLLGGSVGILVQVAGQQGMRDLRAEVFDHIQGLNLSYYHRTPLGRVVGSTDWVMVNWL